LDFKRENKITKAIYIINDFSAAHRNLRDASARLAEIVQWSGHLVVAEKTWVRFPVSA
jgi:hypothetical protein